MAARVAASLGLALTAIAGAAFADTRVGVCDVQRALLSTEEGMKAAATLQSFTKKRQTELDSWQEELQKEQDDLRAQSAVLSRRAFQRRTEHWQRRMLEVQTKFIQFNKELAEKQQKLTGPITQKLVVMIRRAASRKGFDVVIDKAAVPYASADLDLTDMVVQLYNSGGGGEQDKKE